MWFPSSLVGCSVRPGSSFVPFFLSRLWLDSSGYCVPRLPRSPLLRGFLWLTLLDLAHSVTVFRQQILSWRYILLRLSLSFVSIPSNTQPCTLYGSQSLIQTLYLSLPSLYLSAYQIRLFRERAPPFPPGQLLIISPCGSHSYPTNRGY